MAKKKTKPPRVYRDSTTGRFVTRKYAKKHPKTTVKERRKLAPSGHASPWIVPSPERP